MPTPPQRFPRPRAPNPNFPAREPPRPRAPFQSSANRDMPCRQQPSPVCRDSTPRSPNTQIQQLGSSECSSKQNPVQPAESKSPKERISETKGNEEGITGFTNYDSQVYVYYG